MLHETCKKCNRELKDEESQKRGYGPECWASLELKTWKYVYTGVHVPDYDGRNWQIKEGRKWQHQVLEHVEEVGNQRDADFVIVHLMREVKPYLHGHDDVVYFQSIKSEKVNRYIGVIPKGEWKYLDGVNPMRLMYSYAPIFITSEGENMTVVVSGSVEQIPHLPKNILWVKKMQECRYHVPYEVHPFLFDAEPRYELIFEPMKCVTDDLEWVNDCDEMLTRFENYVYDSCESIESLTGKRAEEYMDERMRWTYEAIGSLTLRAPSTVWTNQCRRWLAETKEKIMDEALLEITVSAPDNGHFQWFLDCELDLLNQEIERWMDEHDIWFAQLIGQEMESRDEQED